MLVTERNTIPCDWLKIPKDDLQTIHSCSLRLLNPVRRLRIHWWSEDIMFNVTGDEETYQVYWADRLLAFSSFQFKFHTAPKSCNPQTILNKASFSCVHLMVHQEVTMPNNTTFEGLCSLNLSFSTLLDRWHQFCLVNAWRNQSVKHENQLATFELPNQKTSSRIRITLNMQILFLDRNPNLWGSFSVDFVVPSSVIPPLFKMFLFCKFQLQNSKSHLRKHPWFGQKHPR